MVLLEEPVLVVRSDGKGDWGHAPARACNLVKAPSQFRTLGNNMRLYGIILKVLCSRSDLNWASERIGLLNKDMT